MRGRLQDMLRRVAPGWRDCQIKAINNLEASLKADKPRALIQIDGLGQDLHRDHRGVPSFSLKVMGAQT